MTTAGEDPDLRVSAAGPASGPDPDTASADTWPNAPVHLVCRCGHGVGLHGLSPSTGRRTGCSTSSGPTAVPCPCKTFTAAEVAS